MEKVLENLILDEILYVTNKNTKYLFLKKSLDGGIRYSIGKNVKKLPLNTINEAFKEKLNGVEITRAWYRKFNKVEYRNSPCNFSILITLLNRV